MTDTENPLAVLSVGQQRRVKSLEVANAVMRTSGFFQSNQPKDATELVKLAEWVMAGTNDDPADLDQKWAKSPLASMFGPGVGVVELKGDELGGFLDFLASADCGNPECPVHGVKAPADEAGDDGPEDDTDNDYPINERGDEPAKNPFPSPEQVAEAKVEADPFALDDEPDFR
jgi:hypothetical protein